MKLKTVVTIGGLVLGSYLTGKIAGAYEGAKTALDKYGDVIPDKELRVKLIDKFGFTLSTTAKKGES